MENRHSPASGCCATLPASLNYAVTSRRGRLHFGCRQFPLRSSPMACPCRPASGCYATLPASLNYAVTSRRGRLHFGCRQFPLRSALPVPPGFGLLRNLFRIPCPCRPASGCYATLRRGRLHFGCRQFPLRSSPMACPGVKKATKEIWLPL